jgi:thioredoxin 1
MTVLFFTASWCSACKGVKPTIIKVCNELGVKFEEVNLDINEALGVKYNICSLPTIIIEKDGQQYARREGATSRADLVGLIREVP